jgi:hypothetical protein
LRPGSARTRHRDVLEAAARPSEPRGTRSRSSPSTTRCFVPIDHRFPRPFSVTYWTPPATYVDTHQPWRNGNCVCGRLSPDQAGDGPVKSPPATVPDDKPFLAQASRRKEGRVERRARVRGRAREANSLLLLRFPGRRAARRSVFDPLHPPFSLSVCVGFGALLPPAKVISADPAAFSAAARLAVRGRGPPRRSTAPCSRRTRTRTA